MHGNLWFLSPGIRHESENNETHVNALLPGESAADTDIKGFVAQRLTSGTVTYGFRYRNRAGQQRWLPLGLHGQVTADEARDSPPPRRRSLGAGVFFIVCKLVDAPR